MGGIRAKPLAFLIGIVVLAVSVFGFIVTSPDREEDLVLHSLSLVGIIVGGFLVIYG